MNSEKRKNIPKKVREQVLKEFNHRCALCGNDKPQIHHIDRNHNNNDRSNLLPLCPNCHLIDQHDPTSNMDPELLSLFREYKDPTILGPQFKPLFKKLKYLFKLKITDEPNTEELKEKSEELIDFIKDLNMGNYYSKRVEKLIGIQPTSGAMWLGRNENPLYDEKIDKERQKYIEQLCDNKNKVKELVIELLCYQSWTSKNTRGDKKK
jgi:hypothetical protein